MYSALFLPIKDKTLGEVICFYIENTNINEKTI